MKRNAHQNQIILITGIPYQIQSIKGSFKN